MNSIIFKAFNNHGEHTSALWVDTMILTHQIMRKSLPHDLGSEWVNERRAADTSEKMIRMSDPNEPPSWRGNCGGLMEFLALNPSQQLVSVTAKICTARAFTVSKSPLAIGQLPGFQQFLSFLSFFFYAVSSISYCRSALNWYLADGCFKTLHDSFSKDFLEMQ